MESFSIQSDRKCDRVPPRRRNATRRSKFCTRNERRSRAMWGFGIRRMRAGLVAVAVVLAACATAQAGPARAAGGPDPLGSQALMAAVMSSAALAPDHLPGTADAATTERWIREQLAAAGLSTGTDAYHLLRFIPRRVSLSVEGVPVDSVAVRLYSGTTAPEGISAPLAWVSTGTAKAFAEA